MKDSQEFSQYVAIEESTIANLRELDDPNETTSFVDDLILIYRQEAPLALKGLEEAYTKADQRGIVHWSHKLKGLSRNLGVRRLSEVCSTIELGASKLNAPDLRRLIDLVQQELDEAYRLLHEQMTDKAA